jgi:hypothetical protein
VPDRLVVDLGTDGQAAVVWWREGEIPEEVSRRPLAWPLDGDALEDLRWYLEDYLLAPYGVWQEQGPAPPIISRNISRTTWKRAFPA